MRAPAAIGSSLRLRLAAGAALAVIALGALLLVRGSPSVTDVTIVGLPPGAQPAVQTALEAAARSQTTGGFSVSALRSAVAPFTLIEGIRARTRAGGAVTITVRERPTVLRLSVGGQVLPIDASGAVITGLAHAPRVATVSAARLPVGGRTRDPFALAALRVLDAAPAPLRDRVVAITEPGGVMTVYLHRGPRLIFGDATLPHAKWEAVAVVLASRFSLGATYVDVRIPSRAAAQVGDPNTTVTGTPGGTAALTTSGLTSSATAVGSGSL